MSDVKQTTKVASSQLNIAEINQEFRAIAKANQWQAYHNPKNLASAVAVEASELLAEFQWLTPEESCSLEAQQQLRVAGEIADIIMYLTELCTRLDIDMTDAINLKIKENKQRFKSS